jgi:hypothetical protein
MHELLFHRQKALGDGALRGYAAQLGLDVAAFDPAILTARLLCTVLACSDAVGVAEGSIMAAIIRV